MFTILFSNTFILATTKKDTDVTSSYRCHSQASLPKDHKDIHNIRFQMLTNKYSKSVFNQIFF